MSPANYVLVSVAKHQAHVADIKDPVYTCDACHRYGATNTCPKGHAARALSDDDLLQLIKGDIERQVDEIIERQAAEADEEGRDPHAAN